MYIYIHIPFCTSICSYCDFPKVLYCKKFINKYLSSLKNEILSRYKGEVVKTIYIGGGTPTSLDYYELKELLEITNIFNKEENIEFTIESNIESLDLNKIKLFLNYGVNRISLGVQSFDSDILKELNRYHSKDDVVKVIDNLKKHGINNISIDLIYGVNEDINVVKKDLDLFLDIDIPHISLYSLIIEDNTIFGINNRKYINEDIDYEMYKYIENTLINNNYIHYEVSNYTKDGYQSIHNLNYWNNGYYYGFGMGAVSYIDNYRIINTKNLNKYLRDNYLDNIINEDIKTRMSNDLILGLRKTNGVNIIDFNNKYNVDIFSLYNIKNLIKDGKLMVSGNYLYINSKYFYLANEILLNFI